MMTWVRRIRDCTSGAALLEAAIVMPLVLMLMVGVIEFSRALQDYHTADKSMRSAVRYLARVPEIAVCDGQWGQQNAKDLAVYGTTSPEVNAAPLIRGWELDDVTISFRERVPKCSPPPDHDLLVLRMEAAIPIQVQLLAALGLPSTITVRVKHEERHIGA